MAKRVYSRRRWLLSYSFGPLLLWVPTVLFVGHFFFSVTNRSLLGPAVTATVVIVCFGPLFYEGQLRANSPAKDFRLLYKVAGGFGFAVFVLMSFYGWRLKIIPGDAAIFMGIMGCLLALVSPYQVMFLRKRLFREPRE